MCKENVCVCVRIEMCVCENRNVCMCKENVCM